MGSLSNLYISQSYTSLIHLGSDGPITTASVELQDGLGNGLGIFVNSLGDVNIEGDISASNIPAEITSKGEFNAYTASTNVRLNNLETTSASVNVSVANINLATASLQQQLTNIGGQSGSWITEAETASFARTNVTNTFTAPQIISAAITASAARIANLNYPTADGTFTGQVLQTNAAGTLSFGNVNAVFENIRNGEATQITKGTPLFVSGAQGDTPIVYRADATNPAKMPVTFLAMENIASNATGRGITLGLITGIDMTGYPAGTQLWVDGLGLLTDVRPTGSADIVQPIAIVTKTGNGGQINVLNPGPVLLPNIQTGYAWVGNGNNQPTAVATSSFGGGGTTNTGSLMVTGSVNVNVLTFTKGDGTTFNLTVAASGSVVPGTISGSAQITALGFVSSSVTASSLITASFNNGTRNLTFTKGDNTTFAVNIPDVSGSATGGATLGANTFTGSQTISLSGGEFQITNPNFPSYGTVAFGLSNASNGGIYFKQSGSILFEGAPSDSRVTFYGTGSFTKGIQIGPNEQYGNNLFIKPVDGLVGLGYPSGSAIGISFIPGRPVDNTPTKFTGVDVTIDTDLIVTGSLTASIQNGYAWVGNSAGISTAVPTSSFAGSTIDTSSFARTNVNNNFSANQTISGDLTANKISAFNFDSLFYGSQMGGTLQSGTYFGYGTNDYTHTIGAYSGSFDNELQTFIDSTGIYLKDFNGSGYTTFLKLLPNSGTNPKPIFTRGLEVTGSTNIAELTASLQQGYVWVGDANGRTTTISTGSFITEAETGSFAILGANQIFTGNNTFTGNTVVSQSATFGTASFNGPVVINKGINSNVQITGSLISNKVSVFDFDTLFYGSQLGGTTANGTSFGYGSTDYTQTIGAYGGGFDNELQIYANNNGIEFRDFNQSTYPAWLKLGPNSGTNPAPAFVRGLDITGSLQHSGSHRHTGETYISGNIWVSGSINLLNEGGNGWAFSSKALFLTNSVQTGITVESPIHFYKQTKGNMYITVNANDAGSSGSMNLQVHNNQNLNISASTVIVDSDLYLDDEGGTTKFWINKNFDAEFLGTKTEWNETSNTLNVVAAEETVELIYNGWGGGYDNGYVVNVGSTGTKFQDWNTSYVNQTWLQIPVNNNDNPAPVFTRGLIVTGSVNVSTVLQLAQQNPLPSGADGQLAVSGSNLYFYSGSAWNRIAFA